MAARRPFEILREHKMSSKRSKCHYSQGQTQFLCFTLKERTAAVPDPTRATPRDLMISNNVCESYKLLGFLKIFKPRIAKLKRFASSLYKCSKGNALVKPECSEEFIDERTQLLSK